MAKQNTSLPGVVIWLAQKGFWEYAASVKKIMHLYLNNYGYNSNQ